MGVSETDKSAFLRLVGQRRFGLGTLWQDSSAAKDQKAALLAQIDNRGAALLANPLLLATPDLLKLARDGDEARRIAREMAPPPASSAPGAPASQPAQAQAQASPMQAQAGTPPQNGASKPPEPNPYRDEAQARFDLWATTGADFVERLVQFWSNHFALSVTKSGQVRFLAGAFEREAIRPNVLGNFTQMLLAVEKHPAMLLYLDNTQSIGPHARASNNGQHGLNENLGREILELHTLGAGGGYTQDDVTTLARIITGWTVTDVYNDEFYGGRFTFAPARHEPGDAMLLGQTYQNTGLGEGEAALAALAEHPATAKHIATKLAKAFVADDPPPTLTARLEASFITSKGDLQKLAQTLVVSPEAWQLPFTKLCTPQEFLCATLRTTAIKRDANALINALAALGQPLWQPVGPDGFSTATPVWLSPEGMSVRLDFATMVGQHVPEQTPKPLELADHLFGAALSPETRGAIAQAESAPQAYALLLMSPEFQRR